MHKDVNMLLQLLRVPGRPRRRVDLQLRAGATRGARGAGEAGGGRRAVAVGNAATTITTGIGIASAAAAGGSAGVADGTRGIAEEALACTGGGGATMKGRRDNKSCYAR